MYVLKSLLVVALRLSLAFALVKGATAQNMTPGADPGGPTPPGGTGTTYYVSQSGGNDNNSGLSSSMPWQTLSKVTNRALVAGDTVLFKRGDTWSTGTLSLNRSGASCSPITYGAYGTTGARPKIQGGGSNLISNKAWIVIDRLHFDDGQTVRFSNARNITFQYNEVTKREQACVKFYDSSNNILAQFNKIHNCGGYSTGGTGEPSGINGEGIYLGSSLSNSLTDTTNNVTIRGNDIYNTTDEAVDMKQQIHTIIIEDNIMHTSGQHCSMPGIIQMQNGDDSYPFALGVIIRRNVIYNVCALYAMDLADNPQVHNNLIYDITGGGIRIENSGDIYHNTMYAVSGTKLQIDGGASGYDIKNNIGPTTANNMATSSGLFINAAGGNFRLAAGSAAMNAGSTVGITTDILGVSRPQGASFDYGAYETVP